MAVPPAGIIRPGRSVPTRTRNSCRPRGPDRALSGEEPEPHAEAAMPEPALPALIRRVARVAAGPAGDPDPELLRRFAAGRDEAAFAELVARHGPLVLDVCRAVLGNHAD